MRIRVLMLVLGLLLVKAAWACVWDCETIDQETQKAPGVLELITGRFPRHTPEYYQWRVKDRESRLGREPKNMALLDDLAVSYEKLGNHAKAIQIAEQQLRRDPQRYETRANLGTFYLHDKQLAKGKVHIKKALEINPEAHFGRERYQLRVVEYLEKGPSERGDWEQARPGESPFHNFLPGEERGPAAIKGILGMMRFGHYDSPVLLAALADLLTADVPNVESDDLGARAYLKASYETKDRWQQNHLRALAKANDTHTDDGSTFDDLEREFKAELTEAAQWYEGYRKLELGWIQDGKDPEVEYKKMFSSPDQVAVRTYSAPHRFSSWSRFFHLDIPHTISFFCFSYVGWVLWKAVRSPAARAGVREDGR